jgi:signal transduction histidine kinase
MAETELASMQRDLAQTLQQKNRLAQLGLAVSKINHDLRNMLSSAQLISDRLGAVQDPTVQRVTPKLVASLDRAIKLCTDTLRYGRAAEPSPERRLVPLRPLVLEVGEALDLPRAGRIDWHVDVDPRLAIDADPDQLFRIISNLANNAVQVLESAPPGQVHAISVAARRRNGSVTIEVRDDGPGVPPRAREHLFSPFQGSARKGGTGLGLAIVAELVRGHGGRVELASGAPGAVFRVEIPDRH